MDNNYVKSTIEGLKSTSSSRVQDTLLKIRSKVIVNDNGIQLFRDCGGLEYLLPHLRKPNERILDLTLSILGNCCLEEESSLAVGQLNYFGPLVSILKTVCRDSIVGRACRVIGNLAQKTCNAESLHNHGVVRALITLIESRDKNTSYPTLTMAVRAIRQLWMVQEKRDEMLSLNAVRCIAILLTTECETAGIIKSTCNPCKEGEGLRKSQEELICGILKCLGYFTTHASVLCAEQSAQCIKMASKDWSAGVYWEPKSPEWPPNVSSGSRSAMSPDRAQSPLSPYSESNQSGFSSQFSSSKRTRVDWSPESGVSTGEGSSMGSPYWKEYQWSPNSSGPNSPLSVNEDSSDSEISGRYSPVCSEAEGEVESVGELAAVQVAHSLDDLIMDDDESRDIEPLVENTGKLEPNSKTSRIACVLVLLFRVSHGACKSLGAIREEPVSNHTLELLTGRECLNALLDYVEKCKRPLGRAARILARVLSNALCLMSILKHRLALRLHNMSVSSKHPPTRCQQCKQILRLSSKLLAQMTILAESSYGIGEISYQLQKGTPATQQTLSITLPYVVRTEKPLIKYFIECGALNFLFNIISESKEDMKVCVTALSKLASNVHIKDPKSLENRFKEHIYVSYDPVLDNLSADEIVTFELDDSSTVNANKVFLCQNSEVFSAMLMGWFKESIEKCVRLKNVTKPALEFLLTLLHFGLNSSKCDIHVFPLAEKLETNLEVLLLADRFLFDKLKGLLSSAILQFQLTPESADKIYVWSLNEGMGFLCVESVAYLLTGKMSETQRARSFGAILDLEYKEQWLDDIKSMIVRQLVK